MVYTELNTYFCCLNFRNIMHKTTPSQNSNEIEKAFAEAEERIQQIEQKLEQIEYDAQRDVLKHFDRLHDHMFVLNTIFLTGYIALIQMVNEFNRFILILPIVSLAILIYEEHVMKENARKYKNLKSVNLESFFKGCNKRDDRATKISLFVILLTAIEIIYTTYICLFCL